MQKKNGRECNQNKDWMICIHWFLFIEKYIYDWTLDALHVSVLRFSYQ